MTAIVRFGTFTVDLRARELRAGETRIPLQDQPFQILQLLLERPGELVTRAELHERLWPNGTFVDFEHSVNAAIKRLRSALGDRADRPMYVETLYRRGYRFIAPVECESERVPAAARGRKPRLAVLPFENLNDAESKEYFSDGLASEMIAQLGRVCGDRLGVLARTSGRSYKSLMAGRGEAGSLRPDYLLEGTLRYDNDRVRITAQLVDAATETYLWADTYERGLADCFSVQVDVATRIAHSLSLELLVEHPPSRMLSRHPDAYQAYLRGLFHWNLPADEGLVDARTSLDQALALDPDFGEAAAVLARVHVAAAEYYTHEPRVVFPLARAAAERAIALDPMISDAHLALADVCTAHDWNWDAADAAYQAALRCNPSSEAAHRRYGLFLAAHGRTREADANSRRAYELDPLCLVVNTSVATVRYLARDYVDAVTRCRHTLDIAPAFAPARRLLAASLAQLGRFVEAFDLFAAVGEERLDPVSLAWLAHAHALAGDAQASDRALSRLTALARTRCVSPYHLAVTYSGRGDVDEACSKLARACEERDPALVHVAVEPRFDPLRHDRRYQALITRLRLNHVPAAQAAQFA